MRLDFRSWAAALVIVVLLGGCTPSRGEALPPLAASPAAARGVAAPSQPDGNLNHSASSDASALADSCPAGGAFPPLFASLRYGINAFLFSTDTDRAVTLTHTASFGWVRQQIHWSDIEISPGRYDWATLDQAVARTGRADLHLMLSVVRSPPWATASGAGGLPDDPVQLARFMQALAARYAGRVSAYEIWNEPNLAVENGGRAATPAQYLASLRAAYPAVKRSDPCALVLAAPLASTATDDPQIAADDLRFYRELYSLDNGAFLHAADLLALHPGGGDNRFDDSWPAELPQQSRFYFRHVEEIHTLMQQFHDPRQAWITEVGWSVAAAPGAPKPVTLAAQSENLLGALRYTRAQYPWVTGIFIWNLNFAVITSAQDEKSTFAILGADWSPRPAYIALQAYIRQQAADLQLALPRLSAAAPYQAKWSVFTTGKVHTPPSIGPDGTVYIGSDQGRFYAIAPGGGVRWVFTAPGGTRAAPAFGSDGSIYVGDDSGHLTALRPDGSVRWQQALGGPIHGTPQLAQDGLYLATGSEAAQLDFNGNLRWRVALAGPAAPPLLNDTTLFVPTEAGEIVALGRDGTARWHSTVGQKVVVAPALAAGRLLVADAEGFLTSLDAQNGHQFWHQRLVVRTLSETVGPTSPLIGGPPLIGGDGMIYVGGRDGTLTALDAAGTTRWSYATGGDITATPMRGDDGTLYIGLYDQRLLAVQPNGPLRWQVAVQGAVRATPLRAPDGTLYIATIGGILYALAPR